MRRLKISLSLIAFFICSSALAEWGPVLGMSGYLGSYYGGATYRSENKRHTSDITLGMSPGIIDEDIYQIAYSYTYSPFNLDFKIPHWSTNILGVGALITRCLCEEAFVRNGSIYPEKNYYDNTAYRIGLVFSANFRTKDLEFYWNWILLDQYLIAAFNNPGMRRAPLEYWSTGIGLRIFTTFLE